MSSIAMVRLDWHTVRPYGRQIWLLLAVAAVCAFALDQPLFAVTTGTLFAAMAASYPFAIAEKNHLDTLYGTLPLPRRSFVAGRYLFAVTGFVLTTWAMCAVAAVIAALRGERLGGGDLALMLAVCTALFATVVATQFPLYVRLGYARAKLVAYVPFFLLLIPVVLVGQLDISWPHIAPTAAVAAAAAYAIVALGVSGLVAGRQARRRLP